VSEPEVGTPLHIGELESAAAQLRSQYQYIPFLLVEAAKEIRACHAELRGCAIDNHRAFMNAPMRAK